MWSIDMMSTSETACLTGRGLKTCHHTLTSLKISSKLLIQHADGVHLDQSVTLI